MLRLILPVVLLLLGVGGGVAAGLMRGGEPAAPTAEAPASDPEQEAEDDGGGEAASDEIAEVTPGSAAGTEFVRLNNQFVVPIVRNGAVRSLVVMALTLEVDAGNNETVFEQEPRLRDSFLQVLFAHANAGGFDGAFTEAAAMDPLREALGEAARQVLGTMARDVLIVDITRQDA
jgi:hypothetical protein